MSIENINMIDGGAGNEIEPETGALGFGSLERFGKFDPETAEKNKLKSELQNKLDDGKSKEQILKEINRPIDALLKGRRSEEGENALLGACRARFSLDSDKMNNNHYRKLLLSSTIGLRSFNHPEDANESVYRKFVERYPTAMHFQEFSDKFMDVIAKHNPSEKTEEYKHDMARFKEIMFGDQQEAWDMLRGMEPHEKEVVTEPWDDDEETDSVSDVVNEEKKTFESLPLYSEVIIDGYKYIISSQGYKTMEELEEAHSIEDAKRGMMGMFGQSFKKAPDGLYYMVTKKTYN